MRALFVHDHRFVVDENGRVFSKGKVKQEMFDQYLEFVESVSVLSRSTFIHSSKIDHTFSRIDNERIDFISFKNLSNPFQLLLKKNNLKEIHKIVSGYDFVISRLPSEIGLLAVEAAKKASVKYAIEFVACPWDALWNYGRLQARIYAPIFYLRNRYAVRDCHCAIYVTSSFLQSRYPCKHSSYGISDVNIVCNTLEKKEKYLNVACVQYNIGLIGSLDSPHKGIADAIKAVRLVIEAGFNVKLNILGPGDREPYIPSCIDIEKNINFMGSYSKSEDVQAWLSMQDLYIQPSLQEGLPRAVVEAMNCAVPVIGSNAGGLPELLDASYIHRKRDYKKLSELIIRLLSNSQEYSRLSSHSIHVSDKYDFSKLADRKRLVWENFFMKKCIR